MDGKLLYTVIMERYTLPDITSVNVNIFMNIYETNIHWRGNNTFTEWSDSYSWRRDTLSLDQCLKYRQLTVTCDIEVLSINSYHSTSIKILRQITLTDNPTICRYEWKIDDEILNDFINAYNGQSFWSPDNFGPEGMFALYCCPNGCMSNDIGNCVLFIQAMFSDDSQVTDCMMRYKIECKDELTGFYAVYQSNKDVAIGGFDFWPDGTMLTSDMHGLKSIMFIVTIELILSKKEQ